MRQHAEEGEQRERRESDDGVGVKVLGDDQPDGRQPRINHVDPRLAQLRGEPRALDDPEPQGGDGEINDKLGRERGQQQQRAGVVGCDDLQIRGGALTP
jgi:hypothetical protein